MTTSEKLIRTALSKQGFDNDHIDGLISSTKIKDNRIKKSGIIGIYNETVSKFHKVETLYNLLSNISGFPVNTVRHIILTSNI